MKVKLFGKIKEAARAGYIFMPLQNKREPVGALEINLPKGFNIDAFSTRKFEFGAALTKDLTKKLSLGVAVLKDGRGKTQAGFLLSWKI